MKNVLIAASLLAALSLPAFAADHPRPGMAALDKDGDGMVSQAEREQARSERFKQFDLNNDGAIGFEEMQTARENQRQERARKMFEAQDKNGDGKLDASEFGAMGEKGFERMDRNHDGMLTPEEMPRPEGKRPCGGGPR
ncbi:MAG: EF-hand domain-containing protein [Halothiobacillaceae bacterium]|nr:EF-hand domain-containing protein [Halothiobacillaceae bacterium]